VFHFAKDGWQTMTVVIYNILYLLRYKPGFQFFVHIKRFMGKDPDGLGIKKL
jgi:hypothetical protein